MANRIARPVAVLFVLLVAAHLRAQDNYFYVPLEQLTLTEGKLPLIDEQVIRARVWADVQFKLPYAAIDGEGEAIVWRIDTEDPRAVRWPQEWHNPRALALAVRTPQAGPIRGRLFLPREEGDGMHVLHFEIPATDADPEARQRFARMQLRRYEHLLAQNTVGAAWFRYRAEHLRRELDIRPDRAQPFTPWGARGSEMADTYALFSGGRAVSENLQLDRELPPTQDVRATVDLSKLTGITVAEIDWAPLIKDAKPKLDGLAAVIPADQHAVFFPSAAAATKVLEMGLDHGLPVVRLAEPRSEDAATLARYERQLGIGRDDLRAMLEQRLIHTIALTGSDPYLRTGTDVAIVLDPEDPEALRAALLGRIEAARLAHGSATRQTIRVRGVNIDAVTSPDRTISSYLATIGDAIVLSNSKVQLERIIAAHRDGQTLSSLPEYTFFRDRYALGEGDESAFVFLSDATIRRWCSPKWRIAASRRTRAAAIMSELQARYMPQIVAGVGADSVVQSDRPHPDLGELRLTPRGVVSLVYGSLEFLTPIAELEFDTVTEAERRAYEQWREGYERNWRWAFDPIALRLVVRDDRLAADLTVMPLIWGTDYRPYVEMSRGAKINPAATDPHEALMHTALAFNRESLRARGWLDLAQNMAPGLGADPLAWMGPTISLYLDDDPRWDAEPEQDHSPEEMLVEMPIVLVIENQNSLRLAAFLTGLRVLANQSAPGMLIWESFEHGEQPYVKIHADPRGGAGPEGLSIYYAPTPKALIVTLSEQSLKAALDRQRDAHEPASDQWLGESLCLNVHRRFFEKVMPATGMAMPQAAEQRLRSLSWSNLPILNEWKRMYPEQDPVELHQQIWGTRPICPAGGEYVWNESWQTMESTALGHPGEPKMLSPAPRPLAGFERMNLGITFEPQGLRARAALHREPAE